MRAAMPACCEMDDGHEVFEPWTLEHAFAIASGAARYPRRKPVIEAFLEKPFTVMVRSRIPASEAKAVTGSA